MKGYAAILAVLVLLAVTGAIALSLTHISIDAMQAEEALRRGDQALLFSEACLEAGLLRIGREPDYAGGSFDLLQGVCDVAVEKDGEIYTIRAVRLDNQFERRIAAEARLDAEGMQVVSWKEE